jgi:hypothetical protein
MLDNTFLQTGSDVAEVGIKQIVRAHHGKARINEPIFALVDPISRRFHVVVDATPRNAAQRGEGARVCVEQHFMSLAWVGDQPECSTGGATSSVLLSHFCIVLRDKLVRFVISCSDILSRKYIL